MITLKTFKKRRKLLMDLMPLNSSILLFANPAAHEQDRYPFRQNSNFWYFTGFNEPKALLVLLKSKANHDRTILFNCLNNQLSEIWYGKLLGPELAPHKLGVDCAFAWDINISKKLAEIIAGLDIIYHVYGIHKENDLIIDQLMKHLNYNQRYKNKVKLPCIKDWRPWVYNMRMFKDPEEIEILKHAAQITVLAHTKAMKLCQSGMFEYHLEGVINYEFNRQGARFNAFNTIIGSGANACILHYHQNNKRLTAGDLVLIDAGCEFNKYACDVTRTFPINKKFSVPQLAIYNIVLTAFYKCLSMLRPGITISQINDAATLIIVNGLLKLGIMKGKLDKLLQSKEYRKYYMHGISHFLGLDVHDVGYYEGHENINTFILQPNMVLTIEPGIYIAPDHNLKLFQGIGIRIEDTILITENGNENLTDKLVKEPNQIESIILSK